MRRAFIFLLCVVVQACGCGKATPSSSAAAAGSRRELVRRTDREAYQQAMGRAHAWLDSLEVDPGELRQHGIKGKKKLVEQLDAYYRLWQVAPPADREKIKQRMSQVAAVTDTDEYHDMGRLDAKRFKQDATSYLRAALLMERVGLDTTRYRQEIRAVQGRLDAHLPSRGPHQRAVFHWYYRHFGLKEPFDLSDALKLGVIARRVPVQDYDTESIYELTHEIYATYEYGDLLTADFSADDKAYLRPTLRTLLSAEMARGNTDLTAELLECLHYLRMDDEPVYADAVSYLLHVQNADGSFGVYARQRQRLGEWVKQGLQLHTTTVAIGALTAVFDKPMPPPSATPPSAQLSAQ